MRRNHASLDALGAQWLVNLRARNVASETVRSRSKQLRVFLAFCTSRGVERPRAVLFETLLAYQVHLFEYRKPDGHPLSLITQRERLTAVRVFFRWLLRTGAIDRDVSALIELPKVVKRLPVLIPSEREIEHILGMPDTGDPIGLRDRAMLEILYSTGIRRAELAALEIYDLDFHRGLVTVRRGKGGRARIVPVGDRAAEWAGAYLDRVRWRFVSDAAQRTLFVTHVGRRFHPDALSTLVARYVTKALGRRGACHVFRHAMATAMLERGADIRYIQEMLGHASLETTQLYTHVSIRRLREVHAATHPTAGPCRAITQESNTPRPRRNHRSQILNELDATNLVRKPRPPK